MKEGKWICLVYSAEMFELLGPESKSSRAIWKGSDGWCGQKKQTPGLNCSVRRSLKKSRTEEKTKGENEDEEEDTFSTTILNRNFPCNIKKTSELSV